MSLTDYEKRIASLKLYQNGGGEGSPHKVALLLAIIDLIESGQIKDNRIWFNAQLKSAFKRRFQEFATKGQRNNPHFPFFHLRSEGFWHHRVRYGKQNEYQSLSTVHGPGELTNVVQYAYFDDALFECLENENARNLLKGALFENLNPVQRKEILYMGNQWDWLECEAVVVDYFSMLDNEMAGLVIDISRQRDALMKLLKGRSAKSIEEKYCNISAILIELGQPYIQIFRPKARYPNQLRQVVLSHLASHLDQFEQKVTDIGRLAEMPEAMPPWDQVLDIDAPKKMQMVKEPERQYLARKINFSEIERLNRHLGELGEEFVIDYEKHNLEQAGKEKLSKQVEWVSKHRGDGLGYDIRSFDLENGDEIFIEVKTTNNGKYQPFFMSENEVQFSRDESDRYQLYRVYNFRLSPRLFQLPGAIENHVHLSPKNYKASFS